MSEIRHTRNYQLHGLNLRVLCSNAIAESLGSRFRLLPSYEAHGETITFNFQSVLDGNRHCIEKPLDQCRHFYNLSSGQVCYYAANDQVYLSFEHGVRAMCWPSLGCASFSIVESDPVNLFMASHLLFTILLVEMLKRCGSYSVHAAGFCKEGKAILIPGTSGAGKSTLAITLLRSGFGYLSDDMVFLRKRAGELEVLGLPEDVDVSDRTIEFFPELDFLRHSSKLAGAPKHQVRVDDVYGVPLISEARPRAIIFPQISANDRSSLKPIGADEALFELASNVLLTEGRACQNHLNILTDLARQTPSYRLESGRDFDRIPDLLHELLTGSREEMHA